MKKILFLAFCCAIALTASAQRFQKHTHVREDAKTLNFRPAEKMLGTEDYNYRMSSYTTDDNYITCRFYYDSQRRLEAMYEELTYEYELIDSIRYNEENQLTRLDGYQLIDDEWKHVYYIEYTYNDQGLISTRSNYNNMEGVFELGGVYEYFYNADGQIQRTELTMMDMVYQLIDYVYQDGRLLTETYSYTDPFSQSIVFEPAERLHYTYDAQNRPAIVYDSVYDIGSWLYYGKQEYVYDQAGNCIEYHGYNMDNDESERSVFTYDDRTVEETLLPYTPEMNRPKTFNNVNIYTREAYWTLDVNLVLQYVGDYIYTYVGIDDVSLAEVEQSPLCITPNPTSNNITLSGLGEGIHQMEISDISGRIVMTAKVSNNKQIDLSALQKGCYLVKVLSNDRLHTAKVIVE